MKISMKSIGYASGRISIKIWWIIVIWCLFVGKHVNYIPCNIKLSHCQMGSSVQQALILG
jgi:hypothetical protein